MIRSMKRKMREDGKQREEGRRESSNTQHERMDGMKWSARHTLFLSQCQCGIKSVANQQENVTCEVCCSHNKHVKVVQRYWGRECKPIVARTVAPNLFRRMCRVAWPHSRRTVECLLQFLFFG